MYCPRCGQEQAAGNLKFCSKCGMPITLVNEVVNNGGVLPQLQELSGKRKFFRRSLGLKLAALWFVFIEMLIVPLAAIAGGEEEVAVLAVIGFVGAVLIAILSFMFLDSGKKQEFAIENSMHQGQPESFAHPASHQALPPQQTQPANEYVAPPGIRQAPDTGELVRPGSVTEGTTRLLKKEEDG